MKTIAYLWIILVGSTFSIPLFNIVQQEWDLAESGWPSGGIKIAILLVGFILTILATNKIAEINPSDYALIVEYPDNSWVRRTVDWEIIGKHENGYSMVRCRLKYSKKPARVFLIKMDDETDESGTGTLTVNGNDSDIYYEIERDFSSLGC